MSQQILPPISRLCESIDGTSQAMIADKLGLDSSRFSQTYRSGAEIDDSRLVNFTPASLKKDSERFGNVEKFYITCQSCSKTNELKGVFTMSSNGNQIMSGYQCPNTECNSPNHWGYKSHFDLLNVLSNKASLLIRKAVVTHGKYELVCEDPSCQLKTCQLSVSGKNCINRGCNGAMQPTHSAMELDTQLKYLKSLFDLSHCYKQYVKCCNSTSAAIEIQEVKRTLSHQDQLLAKAICNKLQVTLKKSAYDTVEPDLFQKLFAN